jgi:hypothetical protein
MTGKAESRDSQPPRRDRGTPDGPVEAGYQPQASGTVDPSQVKPPRGDTALVPPQKPVAKQ